MQPFVPILILILIAAVGLPIWLIVMVLRHKAEIENLELLQRSLQSDVNELRAKLAQQRPFSAPASVQIQPTPSVVVSPQAVRQTPPVEPRVEPVAAPVRIEEKPVRLLPPVVAVEQASPPTKPANIVPPAPTLATSETTPHRSLGSDINWEQFMGARLFAWLGGLALFLGVAFFVKYSFDHNLVPPVVRVSLGFLVGSGLIVGGLRISAEKYRVTSQTLIASGIVSLYAVTFACDSLYHFSFFGPLPTFLVMALVTAAAFALAVRLDGQVIAILGILGGFLTPLIVSTGHDNPVGLFGYLAILVIGLSSVAINRRWLHLIPMGAFGSVLMLAAWVLKFYTPEKTTTAMVVSLGFGALFVGVNEFVRRSGQDTRLGKASAIAAAAAALFLPFYLLGFNEIAVQGTAIFVDVALASLLMFVLAWRERLWVLVACAAAASAIIVARWALVLPRGYPLGTIVGVCIAFTAIHFVVYWAARRQKLLAIEILQASAAWAFVSLAFAFALLAFGDLGRTPALLLVLVFLGDAALIGLTWLDDRVPKLHLVAGFGVFAILGYWTSAFGSNANLPWMLTSSLVFAGLHTAFPMLLEKRRPSGARSWWSQLFPVLSLLLLLLPMIRDQSVSFLVWPAFLLIDALAIAVAVVTASLAVVVAAVVLTLVGTGIALFEVPQGALFDPSLLLVVGCFSIFFVAAGIWLSRRLGDRLPAAGQGLDRILGGSGTQLPAFSALLPFILLILICARLSVPDPSPVFGLGLLLVVLALGLAVILESEWLPVCALFGVSALEFAWHSRHFNASSSGIPVAWYLGFYALFATYPFVFGKKFARQTGPAAAGALSGVVHFWMIYQAVKADCPADFEGFIPAAFALAPLAALLATRRMMPSEAGPVRMNRLAWYGGAALFFVTLVFPVQFDRQWLTVSWALEGAALIWLFRRVPHPGLRGTGVALLIVSFARLALNPAILEYHVRSDTALLNWYLYAYGLAAASLFTGARLLEPFRERAFGIDVRRALYALGVILTFILLNLEIADFFTPPGSRVLTFEFSGNFARDMSYTIGWALFALGLLAAGIWKQQKSIRYSALGLLGVAVLKLFLNDLAHLEALYRIGALFAVAVIAIVASVAYQRFQPANEKPSPDSP